MPDPTMYLSDQLGELIDVGGLPDHLKEEAWALLRQCIKAFGFYGWLCSLPERVHKWTVPISMLSHRSMNNRQAVEHLVQTRNY